jgi:DNA-binding phage protein
MAKRKQPREIYDQATQDFPEKRPRRQPLPRKGIAADLRRARKAQGLTRYAVARKAGIPNQNTVRDIEEGRDAKLSNIESIAAALGLRVAVSEALSPLSKRHKYF